MLYTLIFEELINLSKYLYTGYIIHENSDHLRCLVLISSMYELCNLCKSWVIFTNYKL